MSPKPTPLPERIMRSIRQDDNGCWLWQLAIKTSTGYGVIGIGAKHQGLAHRVSYETFVGPIPTGLQIDHLCRVRHCVNPQHLEPVTPKENSERAWPAMKLHCLRGHELFGLNLRITRGRRICRTCKIDEKRARVGYRGSVDVCKRGHLLDYITPDGHRGCKTCRNAATKRWKRRQEVAA